MRHTMAKVSSRTRSRTRHDATVQPFLQDAKNLDLIGLVLQQLLDSTEGHKFAFVDVVREHTDHAGVTREERQPPLSPLPRRGWTGLISSSISRISRHEPAWPRDHRRHHDASSASGEVRQSSRRGARGVGAVSEQDEVARHAASPGGRVKEDDS